MILLWLRTQPNPDYINRATLKYVEAVFRLFVLVTMERIPNNGIFFRLDVGCIRKIRVKSTSEENCNIVFGGVRIVWCMVSSEGRREAFAIQIHVRKLHRYRSPLTKYQLVFFIRCDWVWNALKCWIETVESLPQFRFQFLNRTAKKEEYLNDDAKVSLFQFGRRRICYSSVINLLRVLFHFLWWTLWSSFSEHTIIRWAFQVDWAVSLTKLQTVRSQSPSTHNDSTEKLCNFHAGKSGSLLASSTHRPLPIGS